MSWSSIPPLPASNPVEAPDGVSHPLFPAAPRPDQAVTHPAWQVALAGIEAGLSKGGLIAVIGEPGTGKTLILHAVAERVLASGRVAALFQPTPVPGSRKPDVVLIDDAGRLTASMLRALAKQGRPVVVAGGPALAEQLRSAGLPAVIVVLGPLGPDDAAMFLTAQIAAAERPADLIQPAALMQLVERSRGVPRDLQMLAGLSVFVARLADASQVTPAHVEQAALIQTGTEPGDDDMDFEEDGSPSLRPPPQPALAQPLHVEAFVQTLNAQPAAARPLPMMQPVAPANVQRRIPAWALAPLALAALGAGAGAGWLLIPYVSPGLLALAGRAPGPGVHRQAPSAAAADPHPSTPPAPPAPAMRPAREAVTTLGAQPPAAPRPSAPPANTEAHTASPPQALRPPPPATELPASPPSAAARDTVPDRSAPQQSLAVAAPQPIPPVPTAPEPPAAPLPEALATAVPARPAPDPHVPDLHTQDLPGVQLPAPPPEAGLQAGPAPAPGLPDPAPPVQLVRSAAIQLLPLPPALPLHVVVLYEAGNTDASIRAERLATELGKRGYQVTPPEPGAVRGEPAVSYVFDEDAPAATALAHAMSVEAIQVRSAAEPRPGVVRIAINPAPAGRTLVNHQPTGSRR